MEGNDRLSLAEVVWFIEGIQAGMTVQKSAQFHGLDWNRTNRTLDDLEFRTEVVRLSVEAGARKRHANDI